MVSGMLGGLTTKVTRTITRKTLHDTTGRPRVPPAVRRRQGLGVMLAWAAAVGILLGLADVLREQRQLSRPAADSS